MGATLSFAHRGSMNPDHILYGLLSGFLDTRQVRLSSKSPFVPAARNLLDNLARLGIRAFEWTNHKWNAEFCENASRLRDFVPGSGARPVGMALLRAAWIKLNHCGRCWTIFIHPCTNEVSLLHRMAIVAAFEQTADHVLTACLIHRAPHGARSLTVSDDETRCWLNNITASISFKQNSSLG